MTQETLVLKDQQALTEQTAHKVHKVHKEFKVFKVTRETQATLVHRVQLALRVHKD